jgi:hypothetical protein
LTRSLDDVGDKANGTGRKLKKGLAVGAAAVGTAMLGAGAALVDFGERAIADAAAQAENADSTNPVEKFSLAKIYAKASTKNAQDVLKIITGWGLSEELSMDSVQQLNDELPLAVATIVGDYYTAMTTGRLGN